MKLAEKSKLFESHIKRYFIDPKSNMLFSHLNSETKKEWTEEETADWKFPRDERMPPTHECLSFENSGMYTGAFLQAMCLKYQLYGDNSTFNTISGLWRGIRWNYEISQTVEPGFFCKSYGRRVSGQLSTDQYLAIFCGLRSLYDIRPDLHEEICEMFRQMSSFWIRHKCITDYFGVKNYWPYDRIFPMLLLTWELTGEQYFFDEYNRLYREFEFSSWTSFSRIKLFTDWWEYNRRGGFPRNPKFKDMSAPSGIIRVGEFLNGGTMGITGLNICTRLNPERSSQHHANMKLLLEELKQIYCRNGRAYYSFELNINTGEIAFAESPHFEFPENKDKKAYKRTFCFWHSKLMIEASQLAISMLEMESSVPGYSSENEVTAILEGLNLEDFTGLIDPDGRQTCPGCEWYCKSAIPPAFWLLAYYMKIALE